MLSVEHERVKVKSDQAMDEFAQVTSQAQNSTL